ncbi:replication protein [Paenibacillus sp. Lou8.1]|uniref:replication protein n=1 Tax=Paenibacillus sp. Lou8.1 TaxID=2962041 RepID=UPI0020B6E3F0
MDSSVNPQPTDAHIRISHEIHRELIRRKFTQRQRNIIDFILTLSWGCGKPSAIIPQLKDFELCGVRQNYIREALDTLVECKVIFREPSLNAYQFNKHFDQWEIEIVSAFDSRKMNEMVRLNIENTSPNLSKKLPEKGSDFPKREVSDGSLIGKSVPKKGSDFPKEEAETSRKRKFRLPEKGSVKRDFSSRTKGFRLSKTIFKAIIKKDTTTSLETVQELDTEQSGGGGRLLADHSFGYIYRAYENNFADTGKVTPFETEDLGVLFDDYGGEWLLKAMREAVRQKKKSLAYVRGTLEGYRKRGGPETERRMDRASPAEAEIQEDDPITILMRKADEQRLAEYGVT